MGRLRKKSSDDDGPRQDHGHSEIHKAAIKMKFSGYIAKRRVEDALMYPFILLGRLLAKLDPLPKEYRIFFFFPFYHTGGAEKVHALVTKATGNSGCIIFFTRRSVDDTFLNEFRSSGCDIKDISKYVDNIWLYFLKFIWRGKIAGYINRQASKPVVFNGQSNFGYKISPWIRKDIKQVELIHSFNTFSTIRIPFLPFISQTVMISRLRIEQHRQQYRQLDIPGKYAERIQYIQNAIELPTEYCNKRFTGQLKVLFVGRGTPEKRPGLFIDIAKAVPAAKFTLAGEISSALLNDLPANLSALGNIENNNQLHHIYCEHHILIIPSSTEGFPIVLMEAMARGCMVMATPVGDIPYHINGNNGYVFTSVDREVVLKEAANRLKELSMEKLQLLSFAATDYAFKNFGIEQFNKQYKTILQQ
jgi:L-malate glycosyltransferase